jgi:hypothetical protein
MSAWTWPDGITIDLFHWSWGVGQPLHMIRGWSFAGAMDGRGTVRFEAERGKRVAVLLQVDPKGYPIAERHTFASTAELSHELREKDGQPIAWLRQRIDALAAERAREPS